MSSTGSFSLFLGDPESGPRFDFDTDEINIGRTADMDLQIETPIVSGHHARIFLKNGRYMVTDEESTNGTFMNGMPVSRDPMPLSTGDEIRLGQTISLFFFAGDNPTAGHAETMVEVEMTVFHDGTDGSAAASKPDPLFLVKIGRQEVHRSKLTADSITLGRAPDNDIMINSRFVSRYHARLEHNDLGYRLVVLEEATNPVMFNGHSVHGDLQLRPSDELTIGALDDDMLVTIVYDPPASAPQKTLAEKHPIPTASFDINMDRDKLSQQVDIVTDNTFFRVLKNDARRVKGRHDKKQNDE